MTAEGEEDYHRDKWHRLMEENQLEWLRALEEEDMADTNSWGGNDEEGMLSFLFT
jgi:hypothetical protein